MISVITPANNEERFIRQCLDSVQAAARAVAEAVEHIVVLNRCHDRTGSIAAECGARIVVENSRNLSRIRNRGAAATRGNVLVTIDADSRMTANMLVEVLRNLHCGRYIGGGARIVPERLSFGIFASLLVVAPFVLWHGVSAGMFWCYKKDFDAIGGFDETLVCLEDIDFGKRLKKLGKAHGKRYGTLRRAHIVTSCRKFDQWGDWIFVRHPMMVYRIFKRDPEQADRFYYNARSDTSRQDADPDRKQPPSVHQP
jgi:glycosyltransferase involved in cell wall biosynthesis